MLQSQYIIREIAHCNCLPFIGIIY